MYSTGSFYIRNFALSYVGKWIHKLNNIDSKLRIGDCAHCGRVRLKKAGNGWRCYNKYREQNSEWLHSEAHKDARRDYRRHKKDFCERSQCSSTIEDIAQLDIHHRDNDHDNNNPSNLETLCANCHRLAHLEAGLSLC